MKFDLSIVLLVWQDRAYLGPCLAAIAAARENLAIEIVVVENGVRLELQDLQAAGDLPTAVVSNATNRGVAPARNQGLAAAQGRYLMLLDADTRVCPGALAALVSFMDDTPRAGLAGPRLEDEQGNLQLTCRRLPTVWSKALRRIPLARARAALADELLASYDHRTPRTADYVIGACQIMRREAFAQVGKLDEQFFYGPEDVDYCIRMWRAGWQVWYVPQARVVHREQRLTKQKPLSRLTLTHAYGLARYFRKWRYLVRRPHLQT